MPKNIFQRPNPVQRDHRVARHGAPVPPPKARAQKAPPAEQPKLPALPPLEQLLEHKKGD